jgi:hypothetical protein
MFHDLLASELGDWVPWHGVPKTDALYRQKRMSLNLLEQWVVVQAEDDAFLPEGVIHRFVPPALVTKLDDVTVPRVELIHDANEPCARVFEARRELEKETSRIPQDPGAYWLEGNQAKVIKLAESAVHTNKGRSILAKLAPIPVVTGKGTLELQGAHSQNVFSNPEQELFLQLSDTERFGICKLTVKGTVRIVENLTYVPVSNDVMEELTMVGTFQKQLSASGLYKIWPKEPFPPGEYAVVEYTEGKLNMQIWDFAIKAK